MEEGSTTHCLADLGLDYLGKHLKYVRVASLSASRKGLFCGNSWGSIVMYLDFNHAADHGREVF